MISSQKNNMDFFNEILERKNIENQIKHILSNFDSLNENTLFKRGIYIYGSSGSGKTYFIEKILKDMNYDIIKYDAGDIRNKNLIESINNNNISNYNVLQMMNGIKKKIAIVMDEIDGMNNGDKGGINSLIKLIRQKKTKKQKLENKTSIPIICIGNYYVDKKIKELIKVCNIFELKKPNLIQTENLIRNDIPELHHHLKSQESILCDVINYIQGDLRKFFFIKKMFYSNKFEDFLFFFQYLNKKKFNEDTKKNTQFLLTHNISMKYHNTCINETDRTIVALLWHENIIDYISGTVENVVIQNRTSRKSETETNKKFACNFYLKILDNICFADYIDRITFQNQIWQFNEMSSLIKTFYNNFLYHNIFLRYVGEDAKKTAHSENPMNEKNETNIDENSIRFTKILTKYSTEYNNILFIFNLSQKLDLDKKDMIYFFGKLRTLYGNDFYNISETMLIVEKLFEPYEISKLDIKRIYRYIDLSIKSHNSDEEIGEIEDIDEIEDIGDL